MLGNHVKYQHVHIYKDDRKKNVLRYTFFILFFIIHIEL